MPESRFIPRAGPRQLDLRLRGYRRSASATIAATAIVAGSTVVSGQAITNITLGNLVIANGPNTGQHAVPVLNAASFTAGPISLGFSFGLPLDSHGQARLFGISFFSAPNAPVAGVFGLYGASVRMHPGSSIGLADNVPAGQHVNATHNFDSIGQLLFRKNAAPYSGSFATAANHAKTGYLGFKTGSNNVYGWLRLKVSAGAAGYPSQITLVDTNTPGIYGAFGPSTIIAGQIGAIPEPSTVATGLALFALGAAGVREHRRRRVKAA